MTQLAIKAAQRQAKEELGIPIGRGKRVPDDKVDDFNKLWKSIVVRTHAISERTEHSTVALHATVVCGHLQGDKNLQETADSGDDENDDGDHTQDHKASSKSEVGL